jgi:hypothetical protein
MRNVDDGVDHEQPLDLVDVIIQRVMGFDLAYRCVRAATMRITMLTVALPIATQAAAFIGFGRIFAGAGGWLSLSLIAVGFVGRIVMAL